MQGRKGRKTYFSYYYDVSPMLPITRVCYQIPQAMFISQYGSTGLPFLLRERSPQPEHTKMKCRRAHQLMRGLVMSGRSNFSKQKRHQTVCYLTIFLSHIGKEL